jgi:hypothetical protein
MLLTLVYNRDVPLQKLFRKLGGIRAFLLSLLSSPFSPVLREVDMKVYQWSTFYTISSSLFYLPRVDLPPSFIQRYHWEKRNRLLSGH